MTCAHPLTHGGPAMTTSEPTTGEIMRRLDAIVTRLDAMSQKAEEREKLFVRSDVFDARQATDAVQVRGLEQEVHSITKRLDAAEDRARRMWMLLWTSLAAPLLIALVVAATITGTP